MPSRGDDAQLDKIDPVTAAPQQGPVPEERHLRGVIEGLATEREADLVHARAALMVTDADGIVLGVWSGDADVSDAVARAGIRVGACVAERLVGTSSVSTLVSREPMFVEGPEHFARSWQHLVSAGTCLTHPVTRRVVGSLHLITDADDASPFALSWVSELGRETNRRAGHFASQVERVLMEAYLSENRDSRHAVVAINQQNIVTNAAAARLVGVEEQTVLWEHASRVVAGEQVEAGLLQVGRGLTLRVRSRPVMHGNEVVGVIMRLKRLAGPRHMSNESSSLALPGLAGSGSKWQSMCRQALGAGSAPLALVGERGTGRASVARALSMGDTLAELDALTASKHPARWSRELSEAIDTAPSALLIRHVDELPEVVLAEVTGVIESLPAGTRLLVTSATWPGRGGPVDVILGRFVAVVNVPPVRDRLEDLPDLVKELTRRFVREHPHLDGVEWMSDALQALARMDWTGNVASLASVVDVTLAGSSTGYVGARDLPPEVMVRATGRRLTGLERIEAGAILQALREAGGNKFHAAEALGIAPLDAVPQDACARYRSGGSGLLTPIRQGCAGRTRSAAG
ncbi:helix-turn-helix domain-containing protein [Aeromicrobium sp. UC242_57]|uniref:helix-turn-helix domain-containing protein n=1 Tax=Aeromicrobium sp. UC242_57 TaxID=3374624 RepID=UPI0037AB8A0B